MYCPSCGQQQVPGEVRFCPRCGFSQYGVMALLNANGQWPGAATTPEVSPRKRGVKQGGTLLFAGAILVPLLGIISHATGLPEEIVGIAAIICFLGGFLRMLYAAIFEEGQRSLPVMNVAPPMAMPAYTPPQGQPLFAHTPPPQTALPPSQQTGIPAQHWRAPHNTQEIIPPPHSVTEHTTRMLQQRETE